MTDETPHELRRRIEEIDNRFYEQVAKRSEPHKARAFEYEKLAVDFANKGFQSLTYLNGGALVAIPTAMAFFKADVGRSEILWTAGAFITGLLFVVLAQIAAFFVVAKRGEAANFFSSEQWQRIDANQFVHPSDTRTAKEADAQTDRTNALRRLGYSDVWRIFGLVCFFCSFAAFIVGCGLGGWAVILAKEAAKMH